MKGEILATGEWDDNVSWRMYAATELPPLELCTAVMCVAIHDGKLVLTRNERGWGLLGGHIEEGETQQDALIREALEEGGFAIDRHELFAVKAITHKEPIPHQQPGKFYPFPVGYMAYYWATSTTPLQPYTGEEILESASFSIEEVAAMNLRDQHIVTFGLQAYDKAHTVQSPSLR